MSIKQKTCPTVTIGSQVWMSKELDVCNYRNGDPIRHAVSDEDWRDAGRKSEGAWCRYAVDDPVQGKVIRYLYNGFAVFDQRGLAPEGWHVPSLDEWLTMINYLGGEDVAGGKLKEAGTNNWDEPNTGATNSSGFTGVGSGLRSMLIPALSMYCQKGSYWSSTGGKKLSPIPDDMWADKGDAEIIDTLDFAYALELNHSNASARCRDTFKSIGFLVRCILD
jgi:uncharacterized protein (TIGR02145 family)